MFREMRYVYEVYRERSFSRAAQKLYISQPSLSLMIKKAEERVGSPLFDRSTMPIGLTEAGRQYIRAAEQIMEIEGSFQQYISDTEACLSGTLALGGTTLFTSYVLPPLISRFNEQYPQVHLNLMEATTAELTERLFSGSLDLLIDNRSMDSSVYGKRFFCEEHLLLTVPARFSVNETMKNYALTAADILEKRHLNSRIPPVSLEHFQNESFLLLKGGNDTRERADRIFHNAHFLPKVRLELDQQITAYNLSRQGMGISFSSDTLIRHLPDEEHLVYYKLNHQDAFREVNFYYKRSRYMPKVVSAFLDMI